MQQLNQVTSKFANNRQSLTTTQSQQSVPASPPESYLEQVLVIVADSYQCSAQNPTMAEKMSRAETWARVLWGIIPENRLQDCFDRAFKTRQSDGFPVSAYDLNDAWNVIQGEDIAQRMLETAQAKERNPVDHCTTKYRHINEQGEIDILYGGPGGIEAIVPCPFCRMEANAQAVANLAERLAKQQSNTKLRAI
jgi:hypothetical protein